MLEGQSSMLLGLAVVSITIAVSMVVWRLRRFRLFSHSQGEDQVLVECHFCMVRQRVFVSEKNRFFCSSCEQYNGFKDDGDYNIERPELYDPRLNRVSPCVRSTAPPVSPSVLCPTCLQNQQDWVVSDRSSLSPALCSQCAFLVREHLRSVLASNKRSLIATSVATSVASRLSPPSPLSTSFFRLLIVTLPATAVALSSLSPSPPLWLCAIIVTIAFSSLQLINMSLPHHSRRFVLFTSFLAVCVLAVIPFLHSLSPHLRFIIRTLSVLIISSSCLYFLISSSASSASSFSLRIPNDISPPDPTSPPIPTPIATVTRDNGWSQRGEAFRFVPGDYERGAMALGKAPMPQPSREELHVEGLLSSFSLGQEEQHQQQHHQSNVMVNVAKRLLNGAASLLGE